MSGTLRLKFGTWKEWGVEGKESDALWEEYNQIGASADAMTQGDTPRQTEIICELCDHADHIMNDWDGEIYTPEEAKKYLREYPRNKETN